jgi:SPP1 gp7 family putative phage head morphogenesis protein
MSYKAALDADARLAAKNALKILAALRQTFDAKAVYEQYLTTQPNKSNNPAQDRARARAWAIMNVQPNMQAMNTVMQRVLAEGYVTGEAFADEQLRLARELKKADDTYVDWANWQPGDRAAALLLRPPKAFQQLLQSQGIALKDMSETTTRDIGNAIADAVDLGMSAERSAKNIMRHVANPARALSIAITEQNRAISYATVNRYKEAGLEKMEWEVSSPCDKCARNANAVVPIGAPFPTGATQPPQHPHCRCVLLPVIPDFDDPAATGGSITAPVVAPSGVIQHQAFTPGFSEGRTAWRDVTPDEWIEFQKKRRAALIENPDEPNEFLLQIMRDQTKDAVIKSNGTHFVRIEKAAAGIEPAKIDAFLQSVDETLDKLPEWRRLTPAGEVRPYTMVLGPVSGRASAYTYTGHDTIFFSAKDVNSIFDAPKDYKGWFMPSANVTNENLYTIAHELGHTTDTWIHSDKRGRFIGSVRRKYPDAFSRYSKTDSEEAYAELFAEWLIGDRTNPAVAAVADRFGWNLTAQEYYETFGNMGTAWKPRRIWTD